MEKSDSDPGGRWRVRASVEQLVLVAAVYWLLAGNQAFLAAAMRGRSLLSVSGAGLALSLGLAVVALHVLLLGLLAQRHTLKPLLALMTLAMALADWYSSRFGVVLDPSMIRNVLRTDVAEASELIGLPLLLHLGLYVALPALLLTQVQVLPRRGWRRAVGARALLLLVSAVLLVGAVLASYQPLAALMRNDRTLRYRITPANVLWSTGAVLAADLRGAGRPREPIGLDARPGPSAAARQRPLLLLLVVGETVRAADWGLTRGPQADGRDTTPRLRTLPVLDFGAVQACGTNTEVSVPCLFAPVGRRDYDEDRIRRQQSLLHVVARAGVGVHWRDNQSGCKGVCDGLPGDRPTAATAPGLCRDGRCLDEALIADLDDRLARLAQQAPAGGVQLWVLHMLGNHGPAYFRRHPEAFTVDTPECRDEDLSRCSPESIVNAYDNALRYTDDVLARTLERLTAHAGTVDSALLFVSDHGESLGEHGLYLHGLPYAIAPDVQKQVPMMFWASAGFERGAGLRAGCIDGPLRQRARAGHLAHDHVFHTVLGLLDVRTGLHEPSLDLVADCRTATGASP